MNREDYIVVGLGIAGICFCEELRKNKKSFLVFDDELQKSSSVAGGVYNPVILKRFTLAWMGKEQLWIAKEFYRDLENFLQIKIDYELPVICKFNSVKEQNDWMVASETAALRPFLSDSVIFSNNLNIPAPFGFGRVNNTGMIDTETMISAYKSFLIDNGLLQSEHFSYDGLKFRSDLGIYKNIEFKNIVFAEGFGLKNNPFFNHLPLNGTKGEILIIKSKELRLSYILKSSIFIIPLKSDYYYVGATYQHDDKTLRTTEKSKEFLITELKKIVCCSFEVIAHKAGIRPTTKDRRPLVGVNSTHKNMGILNGLGTRGIMIGPYAAKQLYNHVENNLALNPEININRCL